MTFQTLLGDIPKQEFVAQFFHRLPYSNRGGGTTLRELGQWETIRSIIAQPAADVMICKRNVQHAGPLPTTMEEALALIEEGYTILVRHAERHDSRVMELAQDFERDFAAPVNIHIYATPGGQFGFGWHYDAEDVFILQTTGRKEYLLRKNTVQPWPLEETLPQDMRYEREIMPLMRCTLEAGDWLYIPAGYWHMATAEQTAISLAIGVMSHAAIEVLDLLRAQLPQSILWRQRLPVAGAAAALSDQELRTMLLSMLVQLEQDLSEHISSDAFLSDLVEYLRSLDKQTSTNQNAYRHDSIQTSAKGSAP